MSYYEVLVASKSFRGEALTYGSELDLPALSVVSVPLRAGTATGFISKKVAKPEFTAKDIRSRLSDNALPAHCLELARWLAEYYSVSLGEALRQFAPAKPMAKRKTESETVLPAEKLKLDLDSPLTEDQKQAISNITGSKATTALLHGDTATGKTRVYLELARRTLARGRSVIILTPEISLTAQLEKAVRSLDVPVYSFHSQISDAERKKAWLKLLEESGPAVVIGARSALFTPVAKPGLIVLDEAHEPAYKQDQAPRYHAPRVASQLGKLTGAKVVLGSATPSVSDYYIAANHFGAVVMSQPAITSQEKVRVDVVDTRDRANFSRSPHISKQLIEAIGQTLSAKKQAMIYLNRRGSARLVLCTACGWQLICPKCDLPLTYHSDEHLSRCHSCGHKQNPPPACPVCQSPDIIYRGAGTKAIHSEVTRLFPEVKTVRFDSDTARGQRLNELFAGVHSGEINILVGTQLLAKGLDLPKLGLVGVISADSSLALPDFSSEERSFQLLYQVLGRVGRGHGKGRAIVQTYQPDNPVIQAAVEKNYANFCDYTLEEPRRFRFPPFAYLLQLTCKRATLAGAQNAAGKLKKQIHELGLPVEVLGPMPSFYARLGRYHYWQLVVKSKDRRHLVAIANAAPADTRIDLDPQDLL